MGQTAEVDQAEEEVEPPRPRSPSPPDPLRTLAAELHGRFVKYRTTYNAFNDGMTDMHNEMDEEQRQEKANTETEEETRPQSRVEELAAVRKLSQEDAWAHVVSGVMKEKRELSRQTSKEEDDVKAWREEEERNMKEVEKMKRK